MAVSGTRCVSQIRERSSRSLNITFKFKHPNARGKKPFPNITPPLQHLMISSPQNVTAQTGGGKLRFHAGQASRERNDRIVTLNVPVIQLSKLDIAVSETFS